VVYKLIGNKQLSCKQKLSDNLDKSSLVGSFIHVEHNQKSSIQCTN